jgi:hypothetical protein
LQDETLRNSGRIGDNANAKGNIAGRDIRTTIFNIFGAKANQKSDILYVVKILDKNAQSLYTVSELKEINPDWQTKIDFNKLENWNRVFINRSAQLEKFESEIISNLRIPERLLKDVSSKYALISSQDISSDDKCTTIMNQLLKIVNNGRSNQLNEESKNAGVELTIYWAFTRCQILENPPLVEEKA